MPRYTLRVNSGAVERAVRGAAERGLLLAAEHVLGESKQVVPIDEAALSRSGTTSVDPARLVAAISYDTPYAARQHEELTWRHAPGRTAKYLERPLNDNRTQVRDVIAAQLRAGAQMTYTVDLVEGLAELLAAEALGIYRPDSPYVPGETAIVLGVMPEEPERVICLTAYPVEDTDMTDAITAVQLRFRAGHDLRAVDALADRAFDSLHNRQSYRLRGVYVAVSWRQSQAWIGQDAHGRMELTSNFYFRTTRPGPFLNE